MLTSSRSIPETNPTTLPEFDDFDGGMDMGWDNDEGNVTLPSIQNEDDNTNPQTDNILKQSEEKHRF